MIKCDYCGKPGAKINHVSRSYGKNSNLLIIEDVPVTVCHNCKEIYMTAETMHEIERIKLHRRSMSKKRQIAVAEFVYSTTGNIQATR
jgi:YgiT-type zinc finger domain-containing protein